MVDLTPVRISNVQPLLEYLAGKNVSFAFGIGTSKMGLGCMEDLLAYHIAEK